MQSSDLDFIFSVLRCVPTAIRLILCKCWNKLFNSASLNINKQQAELVGFALRQHGVRVTNRRLSDLFDICPEQLVFDASARISNVLSEWNIQASLETLEPGNGRTLVGEDLKTLALPCLIRLDNGSPVVLVSISQSMNKALVYDSQVGIQIFSIEGLLKRWGGQFFKLNTQNALEQPLYSKQIKSERWQQWRFPLVALFSLFVLVLVVSNQVAITSGILLFLWLAIGSCLLAGLILSFILAQYAMGEVGGMLAKLCSKESGNQCSEVLDSATAKFIGIPHADIGIAYFSGALLLLGVSTSVPWAVSLLGILSLFYSVYSFVCQRFIIGQWCTLCVATQAVVLIQVMITLAGYRYLHFLPATNNDLSLIFCLVVLLLPGVVWALVRPGVIAEKSKGELEQQLKHALLSDGCIQDIQRQKAAILARDSAEHLNGDEEDLEADIVFNPQNDGQALKVILGLSPSCPHCGMFLEEVYQFISSGRWPLELRVRLIVSDGDDKGAVNDRIVAEHLTALVVNDGFDAALLALRNWYNTFKGDDIEGWLKSIRNIDGDEIIDISFLLADTSYWANQNNINTMPALIIQGHYVPNVSVEYSTIVLRKICLL